MTEVLPGAVSDYLAGLPESRRAVIAHCYELARELVPAAVEGVSYGMPALLHRGTGLLSVMSAKAHIGLYPFSGFVVSEVADALAGFSLSRGTIRFSVEQPIPDAVLRRVVELRRREIEFGRDAVRSS